MNIKKIVAVSGLPGLFRLVATKSNGLVVADPDTDKTRFCSVRQHQFTPMETVAIYTEDDTVEISKVFQSMLDHLPNHPVPATNAAHNELQKYFEIVLPNYDKDKVYHSDIKKTIKWFNYLNDRGYLTAPDDEENKKSEEAIDGSAEVSNS